MLFFVYTLDIPLIIEHYFNFNYDEIVESYHDTFSEEGFDQLMIAAEVLGRKSKVFLNKSELLSSCIFSNLEKNLTSESESVIAKERAIIKNCDIEYSMKILKAFQKGIMNK